MHQHCVMLAAVLGLVCLPISCESERTVMFGVIAPQSGSLAAFGPSWLNSIELAVEDVNQGGGILAKRLAIISSDSGGDPAAAAGAALAMVAQHNLSAVIVADASAVARAVAEALLPHRVLVICSAATEPGLGDIADNGLLWRTAPSDVQQGDYMARQCLGRGFTRAGVFYQDDEYGRGVRDGFVQSYTASGGEVQQQLSFGPGQSSSVAELAQLFKDAPDIVILPTYINNAKIILQQWYGLGLGGQWMLSEANFDAQLLSVGAAADGAFVVECGARQSSGFDDAYRGRYGTEPATFAAHAYDALMLLALAAERAGSIISAAIAGNLQEVAGPGGERVGIGPEQYRTAREILAAGGTIDYDGASGTIDFDDSGEVTAVSYRLWQVRQNAFVEVGQEE